MFSTLIYRIWDSDLHGVKVDPRGASMGDRVVELQKSKGKKRKADTGGSGHSRIYLAGAYTSVASPGADDSNGDRPSQAINGVIDTKSPWRQLLEETERALESTGWSVFLPHREVSRWGARDVAPADVATECLAAVASSDAVMGILGRSFGTHIEVGMAIGLGIPTVVVRFDGSSESYFGSGVAQSDLVSALVLAEVEDLPAAIYSGRFEAAYVRATVNASLPTVHK